MHETSVSFNDEESMHTLHIKYTHDIVRAMKIYFTASTAEFATYKDTYFTIRDTLITEGHVLTRDWLPHTDEMLNNEQTNIRDIKRIYRECIQAIQESDVVIVEDTVSNFSTGHQITQALQLRKPILVLWQGKKHRQFNQMFIHGIDSNLLQVSEYSKENLHTIVTGFIKKFEHANETNRFHLVLNGTERQYLDWAQFHKGKSRTKIIRDALHKRIDEDKEYNNYLSSK